jgi:hypothetical protein
MLCMQQKSLTMIQLVCAKFIQFSNFVIYLLSQSLSYSSVISYRGRGCEQCVHAVIVGEWNREVRLWDVFFWNTLLRAISRPLSIIVLPFTPPPGCCCQPPLSQDQEHLLLAHSLENLSPHYLYVCASSSMPPPPPLNFNSTACAWPGQLLLSKKSV